MTSTDTKCDVDLGDEPETLVDLVRDAARALDAAKSQKGVLLSTSLYLSMILELLERNHEVKPFLKPLERLAEAFTEQSMGARSPLLAPIGKTGNPGALPNDIIDQIAGVLSSEVYHRGGWSRGDADDKAAKLLSSFGVKGKSAGRIYGKLRGRTIADWRSSSGKFGHSPMVGELCERQLRELPLKLFADNAEEVALDIVRLLLTDD
jgi:hypothetical protein